VTPRTVLNDTKIQQGLEGTPALRPSKKPNSCVINESQFNQRTCYGDIPWRGVSPYLKLPQSLAFINALLLNFFARSDFIDTLRAGENSSP